MRELKSRTEVALGCVLLFAAYFGVLELRRRLRTLDADGVAARVDVAAVDLQEVQ